MTTPVSRSGTGGERHDYDVVIATDLHLPGGTAASVAEEVAAQASVGCRTGLIHVPSPLSLGITGLNPRIGAALATGEAELVAPDDEPVTRLLVLRHPGVFARVPASWPRLRADFAVMVVNQPPRDGSGAGVFYRPEEVVPVVESLAGGEPDWIPIGPLVRRVLEGSHPELPLVDWDWTNVLNPAEWWVERPPHAGRRPVIGRHSRPQFQKWPDRVEDLLAAYPDDPGIDVAILGGAEVPRRMLRRRLRRVPPNWRVYDFDAMPVREFLGQIDFFVYYHHPGWVESFGRAPLEALASGAVCILPSHFEELFGPAALYAEAGEVRAIVDRLHADPGSYERQSQLAREVVAERFSWATHVDRLAPWLGGDHKPPSSRARPRGSVPRRSGLHRVLFCSSNGTGMGHLTRLLAMARTSDDVGVVFFTLSQALESVHSLGFPCEYFPSSKTWGIEPVEWNPWFERRLAHILDLYEPSVVVFDGTAPYPGILRAVEAHPDVRFVWSRRAMWRPGRADVDRLRAGHCFDAVIEPGELASERDRGETTAWRTEAALVDPIVLFERDELLAPSEARAELGLDPDRPAVLISLGAGTVNRLDPLVEAAVEGVAGVPEVQVCVTNPAIAASQAPNAAAVNRVAMHPIARHLRAFDVVVAAAGYNTFHETIWAGVPSVFVPNEHTSLDDQPARAAWAHDAGVGLLVSEADAADRLPSVVNELLGDPAARAEMADRCRAVFPRNGAREALAVAVRGEGH